MGGARVFSHFYNPWENLATTKNRDISTRSLSRILEEVMEIEQVLGEYRSGDEDRRLCLFLTYRELRDEFSLIDHDDAMDQSVIPISSRFIHRKAMDTILTFFGREFRRPRYLCSLLAGVRRTG
jgi:hypothetical protein